MTRESRAAFRARTKATEDSVTAAVEAVRAEKAAQYKARVDAAKLAEEQRVRYGREEIVGAVAVRVRPWGWCKVLMVNQLTVTIETELGNQRIPFGRVHALMHNNDDRQGWRAKRDQMVCTCGHLNVSHGYGDEAESVGPWSTRIGQGGCGMDGCACHAFEFRDGAR